MLQQLAIFQVIIPLFCGIISFITPKNLSWLLAFITFAIASIISLNLLNEISTSNQIINYNLGGWANNIGIEYKLDLLNIFFIALVSIISLLNIFSMKDQVTFEIHKDKQNKFYGLLILAITGLLGICASNDIFNIYVMLELNAIASYALVASANNQDSAKAGFNYLIFGTIGSTMILLGIGFIYSKLGSLNLTILSNSFPDALQSDAIIAGISLMFFGILMKAALFPFGKFLVGIYHGAPAFVSSILSSTSNKVAIYLILRLYFSVFKINSYNFEYLEIIMLAFAIFAIFYCSIKAIKQTNIKKFLAYSSLSQIGFIIFAFALGTQTSISGMIIYCLAHALEKSALFLAAGYLIICYSQNQEFKNFQDLRTKYAFLSILIIINLLSNIGIPLTTGFIGKWTLLKASLSTDLWYVLTLIIATIFSFSYAFKFIEIILFNQKEEAQEKVVITRFSSKFCIIGISLLTIINLAIGIDSNFILNLAEQVSQISVK